MTSFAALIVKELILIIGGPGTGKTTVINELTRLGHCCYPEVSREVIQEARRQGIEQLFLEKPLLFSELLLEGRKRQYQLAKAEPHRYVFLDRGLPDVLAYMHYIGDSYPASFDQVCREHRYDRVFIMPPWEEIYESDEHRYENFEQAKLIYDHLIETYTHYGYSLTEVPMAPLQDRISFILDSL